jgi:pSer/pThr/pTyr-binding forkhead associated (FHA) protein
MNEKPVLVIREGQLVGQRWTVDNEPFYIGRGHDCQIVLPERQVSRQHVMIRQENGRYILHDLDSKNGTYLNGANRRHRPAA